LATLLLAIDDQTLKDVEDLTTARAIWLVLKTIQTSYDVWHGTLILFEFINLKKTPEESITSYLARRSELYDKVKDAGHTIQEKTRMCFILKGLNTEYEPFARTLRDGEGEDPGDLTPARIKAKLLSEEKRLNCNQEEEDQINTTLRVKNMSWRKEEIGERRQNYQTEGRNQRRDPPRGPQMTQTDGNIIRCYNCKGFGHNSSQCPSVSLTKPHTRTVDLMEDRKRYSDERPHSTKTTNDGDNEESYQDPWSDEEQINDEPETSTTDQVNDQTIALLTSLTLLSNNKKRWILDSAATMHMSPHKEGYTLLRTTTSKKIHTAGTESLVTKGTGTKYLKIKKNNETFTSLELEEVLWVPELCVNLMSVSKLTEQGFSINMDKKNVTIKNRTGVIIGKGKKEGNLYIILDMSD
jgi:hypothetical protein